MPVSCISRDRELNARLTGEVDHHGAKAIMAVLDEELDAALPARLVVDLSGVTFMDSSGIAVLLRAYRRLGELGGTMCLANVPAQAAKVLRAAGLERIIPFQDK